MTARTLAGASAAAIVLAVSGLAGMPRAEGRAIQAAPQRGAQPSPTGTAGDNRVDIVSVVGCLKQQGADNWMLTMATDPVPSVANAPQKSELPTTPPAGKNEYKLIGVGEFGLPDHKDHTVMVRGLLIKATPVNRVNVTSVVTAVQSCAATPAKQE